MSVMIDPRGKRSSAQQMKLARRDGTVRGRVILFDNGKCHPEFGSFFPLFSELDGALRRLGVDLAPFHYESDGGYSHLNPEPAEFQELLARLIAAKPTAVVLTICDVGVTFPTIALALALENAGIRTVSLCTTIGIQLGLAMSESRGVQLPLLMLDAPQIAADADAKKIAEEIAGPILDALAKGSGATGQGASGGAARLPAQNASGTLDMPAGELFEAMNADGLGDGLPVLPPESSKVDALVGSVPLAADDVLIELLEPSGAPLTVRDLAANAALAGCEPAQFPVVVAAIRAASQPRYRFSAANMTTHGSGNLLLVSGPIAHKAGINSGPGCLGPGAVNRANLAVGRTLTLVANNVGRALIGRGDLGVLGTPAEISYCFAEADDSPWPPLCEDFGSKNGTVTIAKCEAPHNILDQVSQSPDNLLRGFVLAAANGASNNAFTAGDLFVILSREHARILAKNGWGKRDIQNYIFENARVPRSHTANRGIRPSWPKEFHSLERVPIVHSAKDIYVVVAGGLGVQSALAMPWGYNRAVTVAVDR